MRLLFVIDLTLIPIAICFAVVAPSREFTFFYGLSILLFALFRESLSQKWIIFIIGKPKATIGEFFFQSQLKLWVLRYLTSFEFWVQIHKHKKPVSRKSLPLPVRPICGHNTIVALLRTPLHLNYISIRQEIHHWRHGSKRLTPLLCVCLWGGWFGHVFDFFYRLIATASSHK